MRRPSFLVVTVFWIKTISWDRTAHVFKLRQNNEKFWVAGNARVGSLSPRIAYKKQEVIGRFSVGRVGPVGRVGRYHAGRICARPTGPTRPTRPTTHKQNLTGLRAAPALVPYRPVGPIKNKKFKINSPKGYDMQSLRDKERAQSM